MGRKRYDPEGRPPPFRCTCGEIPNVSSDLCVCRTCGVGLCQTCAWGMGGRILCKKCHRKESNARSRGEGSDDS